jgi:hypothetical protein
MGPRSPSAPFDTGTRRKVAGNATADPLAVAQRFGQDGYSWAYGRVFTAWGTAGLVGPVGAGHLFEVTGSYRIPMFMAAVAAIGSSVVARQLSVDKKWDS